MNQYDNEQELSFAEAIDKLKKFLIYCLNHYLWFLFLALIGLLLAMFITYRSTPKYTATITFMVKEDEGNSQISGVISAMLGNFGMGGSRSKFNLDKVIALSNSKNIIFKSLLDSINSNSEKILLASYFIEKYQLKNDWIKSDGIIKDFKEFSNHDNLTVVEKAALGSLYNHLAGPMNKNKLLTATYNEENTIISLSLSSISDTLSVILLDRIYNNLEKFYINQSTEKAQKTISNLENKIGIIEKRLSKTDYSYANSQDKTLGTWLEKDIVIQKQTYRDVQINSNLYSELLKNLDTARFTLDNVTPVFQIIDQPVFPLEKESPSFIKNIIIGVSVGMIMALLYLFLKLQYTISKETLKD